MENIAAYKGKYIVIPNKALWYTEDTIQMNGEDWRYEHAEEHSTLLGWLRMTHFNKWEQVNATFILHYSVYVCNLTFALITCTM